MSNKKATKRFEEVYEKIQNKTLKNLARLILFINVLCWTTKDFFDHEGQYPNIERIQKFFNCSNRKAQDFVYTMKAIEILQDIRLIILPTEEDKEIRKMLEQKLQ